MAAGKRHEGASSAVLHNRNHLAVAPSWGLLLCLLLLTPLQALACHSAFEARGGRPGIESALGGLCRNGDAAFNTLGCCQAVSGLLLQDT